MRRWVIILVAVLLLAGLAAVVAGPLLCQLSPDRARARAVGELERREYQNGLEHLAAYARRFPEHAAEGGPISVGDPTRLSVTFRPDGLDLEGPTIPIPASAFPDAATPEHRPPRLIKVKAGPRWIDDRRLAYAAVERGRGPQVLVLDVLSRELRTYPEPEAAYSLSFAAAARLIEREDAAAILAMQPDLAGATRPRLLAVSRDGTWLIFRAQTVGQPPYELWRCRPDGSEAARLTTVSTPVPAVSFSPDSAHLAYFDGPRAMVVGLADEKGRELGAYDVAAVMQPDAPSWSPDGRSLAYGVGSADAWRLITCPVADPAAAVDRPRLTQLLGLQYAGPDRLLQAQHVMDDDRWIVSVRTAEDAFHSRVLVEGGRKGRLSGDGLKLAYLSPDGTVRVILFHEPLGTRPTEALPPAELQERPTGPPAPVSPLPDVAAPEPPAIQT